MQLTNKFPHNWSIINELYRCWSQRLHVHPCMPPLKPPRNKQTICIFFDGGTSVKRIEQREQIVSCWVVGMSGGNLQYVCSAGKCFDFVVFLLGSVTIYSTLSKSNLVLINFQSSIFNIESSGSRQMTKINLNITRSSIPTGRRKTDQVAEHRTTKKPTL